MEGKIKTASEIISPFVYGNYDNPDDASGLPEGDYIEESKCVEAMEIYAKQESDKAVLEFKERLIRAITSEVMFDDGYDSLLSVQNIIEKLK